MNKQKTDCDALLHSPRKHRSSRKRHNQDDDYVRDYRHGRADWRACYRDHDSFMNTLRWMHSRMRTPISEESESESLTDTTSVASIATEPSPATSLSDAPVRKKHTRNTLCRSPLPAIPVVVARGSKNKSNSSYSPRRILSEPGNLKKVGLRSVTKRNLESVGAGEASDEMRSSKEMKLLPEISPQKSFLPQGPRLSKNGSLLTHVASVWSNAVFCSRRSEPSPLVASCGKMVTRLASSLPISSLDADTGINSYCQATSKLGSRLPKRPTPMSASCPLSLKQCSSNLKLPPICPAAKYPNILPSWRL